MPTSEKPDSVASDEGHPSSDATTSTPLSEIEKVDLDQEDDEWEDLTEVHFDRKASLEIARWVLIIFASVYLLCFFVVWSLFKMEDATFDGGVEILRFMLSSILPLVTLAVGYYLGDRAGSSSS